MQNILAINSQIIFFANSKFQKKINKFQKFYYFLFVIHIIIFICNTIYLYYIYNGICNVMIKTNFLNLK